MKEATPTMSTPKYVRWSQEQVTWVWPGFHSVLQPSLLYSGESDRPTDTSFIQMIHLISSAHSAAHVWNHNESNFIKKNPKNPLTLFCEVEEHTAGFVGFLWHNSRAFVFILYVQELTFVGPKIQIYKVSEVMLNDLWNEVVVTFILSFTVMLTRSCSPETVLPRTLRPISLFSYNTSEVPHMVYSAT